MTGSKLNIRTLLKTVGCGSLLAAGLSVQADYRSLVLSDNPVLYFRLSENIGSEAFIATNRGSAGSAAAGLYQGPQTVKQAPGVLAGNAGAVFDGVSQFVSIPTGAPVNVAAPFTVEAWVKPATVRASGSLAAPIGSLYRSGNYASGWVFYQDADGWNYRQGDSSGYKINIKGGGAPTTNTWYHLVATFDGTTAKLYVNGSQVQTGSNSAYEPNTSVPMGIGARGDSAFFFPGSVDEVAIYNTVLAAADVTAHYAAATGNPAGYSALVLSSNPVGYYRLDEPVFPVSTTNSGTLGSSADGEYTGGASSVAGAQSPAFPGFESNNSGVGLNGTSAFVRIPASGTLSLDSLKNVTEATFLCWVKRNGAQGGYKGIFAQRPLSDGLYINNDDTLNYSWNDASDTWGFNSGLIPPDGEWALAAVVVQPDKATFYLQSVSGGFSTAVNNVSHQPGDLTSGAFNIGEDPTFAGRFFNGALDEAALFNKALGQGRIRTYFLAAAGGTEKPQLATDPPGLSPQGTIYSTTTFTVLSDGYGSLPLSYQWRRNGVDIPGGTDVNYVKSGATAADQGDYSVVISNAFGAVTSSIVSVVVNAAVPPTIDQQPAATTRYVGARASFSVSASGTTPMIYQWKFNNQSIAGGTNSTLVLTNISSANEGSYSVTVSNVAGFANSSPAPLSLKTPPEGSYEATVVSMHPLAYWRLNETAGSNVAVDYAGGYNATETAVLNGVPGPVPPKFPGLEAGNTAAEFDGSSSEFTSGASLISNRSQFTILGWFKPTGAQPATGGRVGLFGQNDCAEFGYHGLSAIGLWTPNGGFISFNSNLVKTNEWYFITATADGTSMNLYLNGLLVASGGNATANYGSSSYPFNIGYAVLDSSGNYFLGDIDEVAVFDRALTAPEIFKLASVANGIELKITMETSKTGVLDTKGSGSPHHGYNNGAVWVASSTDSASVKRDGVMQFNPTNGPTQVVIPWSTDFNTAVGTMTFWMRSAGNTDTNGNDASMLIDRRASVGDVIVLEDAGTLFWQPNWIYGQSSAGMVNDDKWHHVAYVYDQLSTVTMYIDGVYDSEHTTGTGWSWPAQQIELGLSHDAYWHAYDGYLDDFRIYKTQLTAAEIGQIYAGDSTSVVRAADLAGRYSFDQAPSATVITFSWPMGKLLSADTPDGTWSEVSGAVSPYYVVDPSGAKYYRLKLQ